MVTSKNALLYAYVLYLVGKRDFKVPIEPLREVIARWFFMAALTGRYSNSPESQIESDLARLRGLSTVEEFTSTLDRVVDDALTADYWQITLPNALATSAPRSPSLYAYYASLNLLDARVMLSSMRVHELFDPALKAKRSAVERHHLFPLGHLKKLGIESFKDVHQIANFALVEWPRTPPSLHKIPRSIGRRTRRTSRAAHLNACGSGTRFQTTYGEFLVARRRMLAHVIKAGFERLRDGKHDDDAQMVAIADLVAAGESDSVEFKSAARYNQHTQARDARIELAIVKTVAAFANATGGTLVIGVNDDGKPVGLENDLALMNKPDVDRYQLWLTDLLQNAIGKPAAASIDVMFPRLTATRSAACACAPRSSRSSSANLADRRLRISTPASATPAASSRPRSCSTT